MDFEQARPAEQPAEQPFSAPGHGEEKELTRQARDPSPTTDGSPHALRKGVGDAPQNRDASSNHASSTDASSTDASSNDAPSHIDERHVTESSVLSGSREAFADRAPHDASRGMFRSAPRSTSLGLSRTDLQASAALAARNASFGMSSGMSGGTGGSDGTGATLASVSRTRFLHGRSWYFLLSVNILLAIVLSLTLVWVSIERMDTNYFINLERANLREKQSLHGKLEVERERLLSPYELRVNAERLGMKAPEPGQIRRMDLKKPIP